jgi:hypothetical protein
VKVVHGICASVLLLPFITNLILRQDINVKLANRLCGLVVRVPGYRSEVRVRFPALPDFLKSSGSGTGSTQPRDDN